MRNLRKLLALLLVLTLSATTLSACGDDDDDDDGGSRKKKEPTIEVDEPTGDGTLTKGDLLYKALGDSDLSQIEGTLPKSVTATVLKKDGNDMVMTMDKGAIRKFAEALITVKIGQYQGNTKKKDFNTVKMQWSDGSDTTLMYSDNQLVYENDDGDYEVYKLTGGTIDAAVEELSKGGGDEPDDDLMTVTCDEMKFKTKALEGTLTEYDEDDGFYIGAGASKARIIPYALLYRWKGLGVSAKKYFDEIGIPFYQRAYGDNLISYSEVQELEVEMADGTKKTMYGCQFTYTASGNKLVAYRVVGEFGDDLVTFTAKYVYDDEETYESAMEALEYAVVYFELTDGGTVKKDPTPTKTPEPTKKQDPGKDNYTVVASEQSKIKYERYDNGLFSAEIPKGWKVEIHEQSDYIHYTFQIYNPEKPDVRILYNMQTTGYWATKKDYDWYNNNYPKNELSNQPYLTEQNTLGVLREIYKMIPSTSMFPMRVYSGWEKIETLGRDVFGGEIIHVTAKNPEGKGIEGICSASVMVFNLYYVNMANAYALTMMTAPEGELSSWITVFEHIYGSIVYSQRYQSELNKQLVASGQATMEISKLCSQMTDIVISGWEGRQAAYDRISQKQSDATLGYERVYDTEKNEIYRAPLDFLDNYSGSRYQKVTDDQYLLPVDGYIQWK